MELYQLKKKTAEYESKLKQQHVCDALSLTGMTFSTLSLRLCVCVLDTVRGGVCRQKHVQQEPH